MRLDRPVAFANSALIPALRSMLARVEGVHRVVAVMVTVAHVAADLVKKTQRAPMDTALRP